MSANEVLKLVENDVEDLWFGETDPEVARAKAEKSLAAAVGRAVGVPPFPAVVQEVLVELGSDDPRMQKIATLLGHDPGLSMGILRLANSPLYFRGSHCESLLGAVTRLGLSGTRDIVTALCVSARFPAGRGGGYREQVRTHCVDTAAIAQTLAREWRLSHTDPVFLSGLLHDVGKLLIMESGELHYDRELAPERLKSADAVHSFERSRLGYDHAALGSGVLRAWELPEPVVRAVDMHHAPGRAYELGEGEGLSVALLRLANAIDYELTETPEPEAERLEALAKRGESDYLEFSRADLERAWPRLIEARDYARQLFG